MKKLEPYCTTAMWLEHNHAVGNEKETKATENPYHASSGASTSGFVKRLRHCSRVKCPALAVSLREPGSSSYSSSLELTRTYSFRRSLFFHTNSRVASSGRSASASSAEGLGGGGEKQRGCVGLYCFLQVQHEHAIPNMEIGWLGIQLNIST